MNSTHQVRYYSFDQFEEQCNGLGMWKFWETGDVNTRFWWGHLMDTDNL
jgi:hypothetical protein